MSNDSRISRRALIGSGASIAVSALALNTAAAQGRNASPLIRGGNGPHDLLGHEGPARRPAHATRGSWQLPAHDLAATRDGGALDGARVRWRATFRGGVPASAAVLGGVVYAASADGVVSALALADGRAKWQTALGTAKYGSGDDVRQLGFFSGVALAGSHVIVASDRARALDARTGRVRWATKPLRSATSDDYFWGLPVVSGGIVLVGSGSGAELPTARGRLTAYRLRDGRLLWSTATVPEGANGGGLIGPVSVDPRAGLAYAATGSPYEAVPGDNPGTCSLIALRLRDGTVVWQDQVHPADTQGFDFNSAPVIVGRRLIATAKDGVYAWDRVRRKRIWHVQLTDPLAGGLPSAGPTGGPEGGPIATDGHSAFVLSNDIDSGGCVAAAVAVATGKVRWRTPLPAPTFAAPALAASRTLCVAGSDGTLRLLDTVHGRVLSETALGEPSAAAPAIGGGRLVVGTGAQPFIPGESLVCVG
ncbi:MAG TPA: PQQ-binding-like beta-propeller repeat protein [Conexibacter sp.]